MTYTRLACPIDGFEPVLRGFAAGGARGCNVTLPFKFDTPRLAARCTARATLAGAANTLRFDADGWLADNTDGIGLVRDIERNAGVAIAGRRVLLIGAGGGAAGALGALLAAAPRELVVANRTLEKARELVTRHLDFAQRFGVALERGTARRTAAKPSTSSSTRPRAACTARRRRSIRECSCPARLRST